jgi:hypothetical protein
VKKPLSRDTIIDKISFNENGFYIRSCSEIDRDGLYKKEEAGTWSILMYHKSSTFVEVALSVKGKHGMYGYSLKLDVSKTPKLYNYEGSSQNYFIQLK